MPNPTPADPKIRLGEVVAHLHALEAKGATRSADEELQLGQLLTEGKTLRTQIANNKEAEELRSFASQSAGMLPLAGNPNSTDPTVREAINGTFMAPDGVAVVDLAEKTTRYHRRHNYMNGFTPAARAAIKSDEYHETFERFLRAGPGRTLDDKGIRTLQEGVDTSGGFFVPEEILNRVVAKDPTPTRVAGLVTQLQTSRDSLSMPKVVYNTDDLYTTGMRVTFTGEIPASATTARVTDPVAGQVRIPVYTAMMSIPLTNDMIEDSAFALVPWLSDKFSETIELLRDNMILNGTGIGQPSGILVNPGTTGNPAVTVSGSASALGSSDAASAKNLIKLAMSLPEQYQDNARWVMNLTNTGSAIAQLVDGNNRPLWGTGIQDAGLEAGYMGRRLVGLPVVLSGFMPNIGSSAYPLVVGDLRGYYLVNRVGFSIQFLRELYAETNQIVILGRIRFGGQVVEDWKLKIFQCHT